ncbi:ATP-binding protein [Actinoplanes philippinensis]|nr:AAA family ATPase [Actinoplanes philippinensis]
MVGRAGPLSRLTGLIDRAPVSGGAVLITGETGVGKSTLVQAAAATARKAGFRVLTCTGVEGETQIGLAGLHELLRVIIDRAEILPPQHRDALFSVFGIGPRTAPDRARLAAAVLGLLTALAAEQPLMIVLDDAQWMDQPTINMIGFLTRRIAPAPIVMVVARRPEGAAALDELGLEEITLGRLTAADSRALVSRRHPGMPGHVLRQVLGEAEGNPLALIELAAEAAGGRHETPVTSLRARLERGFAERVSALSPAGQDLLLLAAAAGPVPLAELTDAADRLGVGPGAVAEAEENGLVTVTGTALSFRHPLIRSAVYQSAGLHSRVRVHQALAAMLTARDQPSPAAWHRAAATIGHDDDVAKELADAADGDSRRGLHGAAMRALERAAGLSRDAGERGRLLIRAAQAARLAGLAGESRRLADLATGATGDDTIRGERAMILFALDLNSGVRTCEPEELLALGEQTGRPDMAVHLLSAAAFLSRRRAAPTELMDRIGRALAALDVPDTDPRLVIAHACLAPARHAAALLPRLRAYADDVANVATDFVSGLATAAQALQDWEAVTLFFATSAGRYRDRGALADSIANRAELALAYAVRDRLDDALAEAESVGRDARDGDLPVAAAFADTVIAFVHAWQGRPVRDAPAIRADIDALRAWAAGLSALAGGDPATAYEALRAAAAHPDIAPPSIADLAEAAVGAGRRDAMRDALDDAARLADATASPLVTSLVHRARAVLGEDPEGNFRRALLVPGAESFPLQIARTRLAYGRWLHRAGRDTEARAVLAMAAAGFERAGAPPWAARARTAPGHV